MEIKEKRVILRKEKVKIINRKACEKIQRGSPDIKPLLLSCQVCRMKKYSIDLKNLKKEIRLDYYKSSGPGGQHKYKTMSCVRLYHKPTGIRVIATESRSQIKNRELAFKRLQVKLMELNIKDKERILTKKPRYVKIRILQNKKKRSEKKQSRKRVSGEDAD